MILFWVICALLIVIALAFVLPAARQRSEESNVVADDERKQANIAIYRDQLSELEADLRNGLVSEEQYAQDHDEIERRLLEDTRSEKATPAPPSVRNRALLFGLVTPLLAIIYYSRWQNTPPAVLFSLAGPLVGLVYYLRYRNTSISPMSPQSLTFGLGIVFPLAAVGLYLILGAPEMISNPAAASTPPVSAAAPASQQRSQEQIEANVAKLAQRLQSNPNDPQGWAMLARSYSSMEKYSEAADAYAKATELNAKDADLLAEYAFATGMAEGRSLEGKPTEIINRALKVDPENPKALQLAGSAAFQAKDYKKAIDYWQRVLKKVPPGSEVADTINARINEAKTLAASK